MNSVKDKWEKEFDEKLTDDFRGDGEYWLDMNEVKKFIREKISKERRKTIDIEHLINAYTPPEYSTKWFKERERLLLKRWKEITSAYGKAQIEINKFAEVVFGEETADNILQACKCSNAMLFEMAHAELVRFYKRELTTHKSEGENTLGDL
jgi:hypothetical protein